MARFDPQCAEVLRRVAAWGAPAQPSVEQWRELERRRFAEFAAAPDPVADVRDTAVAAPGGPVGVRIYRPLGKAPAGTFVWLHGGGWVVGSPALCDDQARALANASACVVVSVDYRLAPEHPFPDGLEDCLAVVRWAAAGGAVREVGLAAGELARDARQPHADDGPAAGRLIVGGDSAGGNLAAAVTLIARDAGEPAIDLQVLVHPAVDRNADTPSIREFATGHGLTADAMRAFWDHYAGPTADPLVSPLRARSLQGLPPAVVITVGCDILRDEGEDYARRLSEAGVPVTLHRYEGMMHGFMAHAGIVDGARAAFDDIGAAVRSHVGAAA
jgi:acetyl esterase